MNINEENSGSSNNGGKGRFSERLKKIARDKRKKIKTGHISSKKKMDVRVLFKPFLIASTMIYGVVKPEKKKQKNIEDVSQNNIILSEEKNDIVFFDDERHDIINEKTVAVKNVKQSVQDRLDSIPGKTLDLKQHINNKTENVSQNVDVPVKSLEEKISSLDNLVNINSANSVKRVGYAVEFTDKIRTLQKDIIGSIKKRLVKTVNELEILNSEFYILKDVTNDDVYLNECQDKIKEAKRLISKIKSLKEKYDYLKDNIDFDDLMNINDSTLVDQIIELKNISTAEDIKVTIDNYKILEEYKSLYLKIDKLEEDVEKYNKYKKDKEDELRKRDIDFDRLKEEVFNKTYEQRRYEAFVKEQNMIIKNLDEKLMKIDSYDVVNYKLKGFNELVGNSFKYLGLLIASPLKGLFPGIVTQTIVTKNIIGNLYNNLEWEEEKKKVYETVDFSSTISSAMNDLNHMLNLVNGTLEDVRNLKEKYAREFSKYQSSFSEYDEIIRKINKMENAILNNKIKIQLMQERMKEKEMENSNKLKMVKKLNCSSNN